MAILKNKNSAIILSEKEKRTKVFYIHGPDAGLISERIETIKKALGSAENIKLKSSDLTTSKDCLIEEAFSFSMFSDNKIIEIEPANISIQEDLKKILETTEKTNTVIINAGDTPKSNAARSLCEKHDLALTIPCYQDTIQNIREVIRSKLHEHHLSIDNDALDLLSESLGIDRGITTQEIEKLITFKWGEKKITLEDVTNSTNNTSNTAIDDIIDAFFNNQEPDFYKKVELYKQRTQNVNAVLPVILKRITQMIAWKEEIKSGKRALREESFPDVFWNRRTKTLQHLKQWESPQLVDLLGQINSAVLMSRKNSDMAEEILSSTIKKSKWIKRAVQAHRS